MFMMNYLFDFNETEGVFSGDRSPGPLLTSKNWLKLTPTPAVPEPGTPFPAGFNPEIGDWSDLGDMDSGSILIPSTPPPTADEGNIGIRIALDPRSPIALPLGPAGADL